MSDASISEDFGRARAIYEPLSGFVVLKIAGKYRQEMTLTPAEFADLERAVDWAASERDSRKAAEGD
jgi:hypothetical protein